MANAKWILNPILVHKAYRQCLLACLLACSLWRYSWVGKGGGGGGKLEDSPSQSGQVPDVY